MSTANSKELTMAIKKASKPSRAAKMRKFYTENPTATVSEVAKKFKTTYSIAYMCKRGMQPKKLVLQRAEVEIANRLGIPTVEYARQKAKILKAPKKKAASLPTPEAKDGYLYTWVNTNGLNEEVKAKLAERLNPETITMEEPQSDPVNHPAHYKVGGIETIDFIEAKKLGYHLGNAVKYISRADHKGNRKQDLEKAKWYIDRAIAQA
jgi:hypothetical protein